MKTRITELLGIEYPIIQGGMAWVAESHLAAAVSAQNGLTVIGGNNNQGKTSVLDSIAWALGGEKYRPSEAARAGSAVPPALKIVMDNGLIVERKGKNSALKVTDPSGKKAGQQLLNEFVEERALNLPKFMEASGRWRDIPKRIFQSTRGLRCGVFSSMNRLKS